MELPTTTWKRGALIAVGFGAGFAICAAVIAGTFYWYSTRPKPWNKTAITAEYDYVHPEGEKDNLTFHYILQNNTDSDYRIASDAGIEITGKLKQEKGFRTFANRYETTEYPVFVPAKSRVRISLAMPYPYPVKEKDKPTAEERKQFTTEVVKYVVDKMGNLDGFVLFDTVNRYEIDFPNGWEERAKDGKLDAGVLRPRMTMPEVEGLFGNPDRTEVIDGKTDGKYENPKQIIWTYSRHKITESGEQYGQPGHIRFIPVRFLEKDSQADETARKYGEQSDAFRVCSFRGSFPINKKDWEANDAPFGLLDGFPIKEVKK